MIDVIVIGGGPAGMSVALNLLRAGHTVLILEKENFGGQIANSPRVENIPGGSASFQTAKGHSNETSVKAREA